MLRNWKSKQRRMAIGIGILICASFGSFPAIATEADPGVYKNDMLNVEMPVIEDQGKSPFDFILDPQELLYQTGAERYGGGTVDEGATLLFYNREGQYGFSRFSDRLTIKNKGTDSVTVTVSVSVTGLYEISLREDKDFAEGERSFYLAIVDSQGNEEPISADGEASVSFDMGALGDDGDFGEYAFGLTGCCNPDADWKGVSDSPGIKITWCVEPKSPEGENRTFEEKAEVLEKPEEPEEPESKSGTAAETDPAAEETAAEQEETMWEVPETPHPDEIEPESETVAESSDEVSESTEYPGVETGESSGTEKSYLEETEPKPEFETDSRPETEEKGILP